ncbi:hypothetical protein [Bosea beijingensis]|jgi:hypothetical protein
MLRLVLPIVAIALASCQTAQNSAPVLARIDGRSASSSPVLAAQAKQDMAICKGEANKASLSAPPVYYSLSLANNLAADQAIHSQRQKVISVYVGCMTGRGYMPTDKPPTITE